LRVSQAAESARSASTRERAVRGKRDEGGGEVRVVRSGTLEAPAAVRSGTPRGRGTQKTPCGGAHDAQTRGADVPSHALMIGLEEGCGMVSSRNMYGFFPTTFEAHSQCIPGEHIFCGVILYLSQRISFFRIHTHPHFRRFEAFLVRRLFYTY
jgi:hypothetical protein